MNKQLLTMTPKSPMQKVVKLAELLALQKQIKPQIEELRADLLKITQDLGVLNLKTEKYTLFRAKRITPQIVSFKQLRETLDRENIPYEVEEVFTDQTKIMFKQTIEEKRELPGLKALETEYISIRLTEKKKIIAIV